MSDLLAAPLTLPNGTILRNRFAKAAMSETLGTRERTPSKRLLSLYERWARSGAALLISGNVMVDPSALGESGNIVVADGRHQSMLARWAAVTQAHGAQAWLQLNHPGRQAPRFLNRHTVAPSAVPLRGMAGAFATPRALGDSEIERIVQRFATTASVAVASGFAGVQIHGAHGYLVSQFLSPLTNTRTDRWGGPLENRMRFLREVLAAVRAAVPGGFGVGLKLNSADFQRGGFEASDALEVVRALDGAGVDLLEVSGGTYERTVMWDGVPRAGEIGGTARTGDAPVAASTRARAGATRQHGVRGAAEEGASEAREAYFQTYAEQIRTVATMPLMLTGGFRTAAGMRAALASRAIDVIGLARPMALEPELPAQLLAGATDRARSVALAVGIKRVDTLLDAAFYKEQIRRLATGREPGGGRGAALAGIVGMAASYFTT